MSSGDLAAIRDAIHSVCEHVLAAALHQATGRIGLRVTAGGFATPAFGPDERVVRIGAAGLTVTDRIGTRSEGFSTLRAAGRLVGVEPGAPADVYTPATPCVPDAELGIEPDAAAAIIDWYVRVSDALTAFAPDSPQTLWPEHLDVAIRRNDYNFGGLAGDSTIADPYVYVGPPSVPASDPFFTEAFGAVRTWTQAPTVSDIEAFFSDGAQRARELGGASA